MKIALTSDLHNGCRKNQTIPLEVIVNMIGQIKLHSPDCLVICGDYNGGTSGHHPLLTICKSIRQTLSIPIISVLGNHDYWTRGKVGIDYQSICPTINVFKNNLSKIRQTFKDYNVVFLDDVDSFKLNDITFIGDTMWYNNSQIQNFTNDSYYLPSRWEGDTNKYLLSQSLDRVDKKLDKINKDEKIIFVSHFGVAKAENDYKFDFYGGPNLGNILSLQFNIKNFFNGHSHTAKDGILVKDEYTQYKIWESGVTKLPNGGYGDCQYLIIDSEKDLI